VTRIEASTLNSTEARTVESPLVSVVVPVHGSAEYLETTLRAIQDQTYRPIEVVIVNERATGDLRSRVRAVLPDAIVADSDGPGPGTARNSGLAHAAGQFVAFLDCDDVWLPDFVSVLVAALTRTPSAVLAGCTFIEFDARGPRAIRPIRRMRVSPDAVRSILIDYQFPPSVVLCRRDVVDRLGGWNESRALEDRIFFGRMAVAGPVVHVDRPLALYRVHPDSRSQHGHATDPHFWYLATRRSNETVLKEVGASPSRTRLERDLDAQAHGAAAQFYLLAGNRRMAVRAGLKALRLAPTTPEPYFVLLRTLLGDRVTRRLRSSVEPTFSEEIQEQVRRANQPTARLNQP
jgi:glycosyltransferase involved in cell wall biosynthesis